MSYRRRLLHKPTIAAIIRPQKSQAGMILKDGDSGGVHSHNMDQYLGAQTANTAVTARNEPKLAPTHSTIIRFRKPSVPCAYAWYQNHDAMTIVTDNATTDSKMDPCIVDSPVNATCLN